MAKGACWHIFGIPVLEVGESGRKCRQQRLDARSSRNQSNNERKVANTWARNFGTGTTPGEEIVGDVTAIVPDLVSLGLAGGTGGLSAIPQAIGDFFGGLTGQQGAPEDGSTAPAPAASAAADYLPVALAAGAGLVLLLVLTDDGGKRR